MGYKSFRDVYHKLAIVLDNGKCYQDMKNIVSEKVNLPSIEVNSVLVYGYIDKIYGFSYTVLGFTYYEDGDYTLVWPSDEIGFTVRGGCYQNYEFVPIENKALSKRFSFMIDSVNKGYSNEDDEIMRSIEELDPFRHHDYPDDVEIIIQNHEKRKSERMWARLKKYEGITKDGIKVFYATLLDEPYEDIYNMHHNDDIAIFLLKYASGEPVLLGQNVK